MVNRSILARSLAARALQIAQGYADARVHEVGGNNQGDQVQFFQHMLGGSKGDPWCADFVSTCLVKAYAQLGGLAEDRASLPGYVAIVSRQYLGLSGYCPALWANAKQRGMTRDRHFTPAPGDLVLFDFESQGEPHHVAFVLSLDADGTLHTVEGNTSGDAAGSQADGDGVFRKTRGRAHVFGFVHFA